MQVTPTGALCAWTSSILPEILVLAGRMAPPASPRISARLDRVQGHVSPVNIPHPISTLLNGVSWNRKRATRREPDAICPVWLTVL